MDEETTCGIIEEVYQRAAVVEEARTWLRTPFHNHGAVKGAGVDCLMLLVEVYSKVGVIPRPEVPRYSSQWHLHRDVELYIEHIVKYAAPVDGPLMGDVALFKFGRAYSHAGIIVSWPTEMIHSYVGVGVCIVDPSRDSALKRLALEAKFFSPWRLQR